MEKIKFKTYLFDFDGTLVDSMPTFASVMLRILDENQIPYDSDIVKTITPLGYKGTAQYFISLGLCGSVDDIVKKMNDYAICAYENHILAKQHVIDVLKTLKQNGACLNILTASPHSMLDSCLKRLGIYELFTNVWSCNDFGTTKSDPNIYVMAAQKIGAPIDQILFLDDNYNACNTAKLSGMHVCGVYDLSSSDYADDIKSITDYYITDFSQLLTL